MKRREILRYTAMATGAALSAPLVLSLNSCRADEKIPIDEPLAFFSEDKIKIIRALIDTILPKSDSPSASEVGVHKMIDRMVGKVYSKDQQEAYKKSTSLLFAYLEKESKGKGFHKISGEEQLKILSDLSNTTQDFFSGQKKTLLDIKQQTIAYYLNSEAVAMNHLNYLPVPGQYQGCISLESVGGKAWAL